MKTAVTTRPQRRRKGSARGDTLPASSPAAVGPPRPARELETRVLALAARATAGQGRRLPGEPPAIRMPCLRCGCTCSGPLDDPARWRTVRELAAQEGVARQTVGRWIAAGLVHAMKLNGKLRVRLADERERFPPPVAW